MSTAATEAAREAATGAWLAEFESGALPRVAAPGLPHGLFGAWQQSNGTEDVAGGLPPQASFSGGIGSQLLLWLNVHARGNSVHLPQSKVKFALLNSHKVQAAHANGLGLPCRLQRTVPVSARQTRPQCQQHSKTVQLPAPRESSARRLVQGPCSPWTSSSAGSGSPRTMALCQPAGRTLWMVQQTGTLFQKRLSAAACWTS